jgi:uncharacterized membrane protein YozB (DUF420 family)
MLAAVALVLVFLVAYVLKVIFLGHERVAEWSEAERRVLYVHEACIAVMLSAGAVAGLRAWRLRRTRNATLDASDPPAPASLARWHRRAGWTAVVAAAAGWVTALLILIGMYQRAGAA